MRVRRGFAVCLLCALTAVLLLVPASAHGCGRHGGHHGSQRSTVQPSAVALCALEDCAVSGRHSHGGVVYCGYAHESGFCDGSCRALCALEDCAITGRHSHGGVVYCGYAHESGFCDGSCRALCALEDCAISGRHSHGGVVYCGYAHGIGFCDGSCQTRCGAA